MVALTVSEIQALFAEEADERLRRLGRLLLELEQTGGNEELIGSIFREIHTLKGSSAVAGLDEVSHVAHDLEQVVDDLRAGRRLPSPELIDTLLAGSDELGALIAAAGLSDPPARIPPAGPPSAQENGNNSSSPIPDNSVRSPATTQRQPISGRDVVMVRAERLEELVRLVGESASAHLRVGRMLKDQFGVDPASCAEFNELSRALNIVQDRATRTQMVPVATVTDRLRRAIRDLARTQGKDIRWEVRGADTELDRGVLHQLSDSLLHVVRNAVDHGIESAQVRAEAGKPPQATIRLHAMQLGSEVIIAVTDDGCGIDVAEVRVRAERQGIATANLTEEDLLALTLRAGLSTAALVTDVSGRGVGLDVVRSNVDAARGRIEIRSEPGVGTEFRIIVPITLTVLRCLLVDAGGQRFALPFHNVVLSQAYDPADHFRAEGREVVWVKDHLVAISSLSHTLRMSESTSIGPIVVVAGTVHRHAFQVDRLVGQRDVVVKGLTTLITGIPVVAGASVEPDGSILLVLDPPGLIARAHQLDKQVGPLSSPAPLPGQRPCVLIVDDALTVRELQRSILERAGFDVRVAVDGANALASLNERPADLVLTDVEMPLMDGFELTMAIRAHPSLSNIPVLILSSRSSDADRQRGLDAGADGYLAKSGFDEAGLLTAVHRLLGARVLA